jgi:phospholipase A1
MNSICLAGILLLLGQAIAASEVISEQSNTFNNLNQNEKFTTYMPTYFIFGKHDLKLQFSFKYRLANSIPLYFGYGQLMFWNIYEKSMAFREINYIPEVFYRFLDQKDTIIKSIDVGHIHNSNGKKKC